MKRWLGKSLKRKLSFMLLVIILIPLLSLGFVSYLIAAAVTEDKAKQSGMNMLRQINTNFEFIVQDVENMSLFLIGQDNIQQYLSGAEVTAKKQNEINGFLTNLAFSKTYISNITIRPLQGEPFTNTAILQSNLKLITDTQPDYFQAHSKWWSSLYENNTPMGVKKVISLVRPIRNMNTFHEMGMLIISIDQQELTKYLMKSEMDEGSFIALLDSNNRVIAGSNRSWLNHDFGELFPGVGGFTEKSGTMNDTSSQEKRTVLYDKVPYVNWTTVGMIPFREYQAQNTYVLKLTAVAVGVAIVLIMILVLSFVQQVTKPLLNLSKYLRNVNPDESIPTYPVTTSDEVGMLIHSYNKLGDRMEWLKEEVTRNETRKKEADMQALQAQINPHFLYNTLSSIHWMALMSKDGQIAEMVGALSDFLRFSLNKGEEYCAIHQEVAHAHNYVQIQMIRFPNQFEVTFYVDPELRSKSILKLLLQPLIENAMIHGIQKQGGTVGQIYVHIDQLGSDIRCIVEDTGVGIEPQKLSEITAQLNAPIDHEVMLHANYGLRNVHRRLVLHYGNVAGLQIDSVLGKGTRVTFSIPAMKGG
ncbi:sensor histidine kinase [Paenibacillus sp. N1-5-1-14]|uniref:cache domain-containing sensor histidine kinase n=1 Tax=Paenibacillus radicibacter TaxID=2972488 RepID=UPI002158DDE9|nr:sensor histidine kinase [Paenibacillus radicibacter]MCR8642489.1 sensor histidine kinase [Paenibacillus radicibacter]